MKDNHLAPVELASEFGIGDKVIRNRVVLAPMSGVTDLPFRKLAWRFGAGLVVTEMVASRELVANKGESWARLKNADMTPHVVQLAGREPYWVAEAAKIAADNGAGIIDINMGCPAKKVIGGYSGSALMRDPDLALSMIEATVKAVDIPVTVKMRLGWDHNSLNAAEISLRAEQVGAQAIIIHGRTRMQFYEGKADWAAIKPIRDAIKIPLIANGDVLTKDDAVQILALTGADAVMVGRGAQGQPWLPATIAGYEKPSVSMIADIAVEHYEAMLDFYGVEAGLRHARKHVGWYLESNAGVLPDDFKKTIMTSKDPKQVVLMMHAALLNSNNTNGVSASRTRDAA